MQSNFGQSGASVPGGAVFDAAAASADLGLTLEEFAPLLTKAAVEIRLRLDAVKQGMAESDLDAVALNSHTMKSVAATLGAEAARQAAFDLERCAKTGDVARSHELLAELEPRALELLAELDRA
ncbi:Hpt domain-containing protein [uncultured Pseudodesulfovibrio sp.]|uniref:Hpt domain-containing protein n=1 Tax=uncultured Pseudodesulfovibrio sp. TaxID=2035858 RepID=UPI0029C7531F|nr:Hpt domain-containing protein [uncultured Pseudodesulfovibrio sp.]